MQSGLTQKLKETFKIPGIRGFQSGFFLTLVLFQRTNDADHSESNVPRSFCKTFSIEIQIFMPAEVLIVVWTQKLVRFIRRASERLSF